MTLPVIYAFEHAGPDDRASLEAVWRTPQPSADQIAAAVALIERLGGRAYTRAQAASYRDRALAELAGAGVVDGAVMDSIRGIVTGVIKA
jgi:geranylgeranyl pyrophosphate synthase